MKNEIKIAQEDDLSLADQHLIHNGLGAFNHEQAGESGYAKLRLTIRDADGSIMGGLLAETYWGWMFIETLWIDKSLRGQGVGSKLIHDAEAEAIRRGCTRCYLDTFSFQARPFYESHGYSVFASLPNFPEGHQRHFLVKDLVAS